MEPLLERLGGVATVSVQGGQDEIVRVDVSQNRLEAYNLTLTDVAASLDTQNYQLGSGELQEGVTEYLIRTDAEFSTLDQIANVVVSYVDNSNDSSREVYLKDLAEVSLTNDDEDSRVYINSQYGVTLSIQKESDANSISVSDSVNNQLQSINDELPDGVEVVILSDDTTQIESIMSQTYNSLFQGIALAMIVLFFFLRTWASTIIIALSIPLSILVTVLFMYFMGLTINLMTLTGLILGLGMVVDCSIVIQENIFKFRERGTKLKASAILGSREMIMSITASTLTTVCVFIPIILFADDLEMIGQVFKSLSWTIIIALSVSLIVAVTFVPTMAANYLKIYTRTQKPLRIGFLKKIDTSLANGFERLDRGYTKLLDRLMDHKGKVLLLVFALLALTVGQMKKMGIILAPSMSEDSISVSIELPQGTPLDETEQVVRQLVDIMEGVGGYENMIVTVGEASSFMGGTVYSNKGEVQITLPDYQNQSLSSEEIKNLLRGHFNDFPGATVEFSSRGPGMGNDNPVDILVKSDDLDAAIDFADELKALIKENLPGVTEPSTDMDEGLPQIEVEIDRERAYDLGLNMYTVASEIGYAMNGYTATTFRTGGDELDVKVILQDEDRLSSPDLTKIFVVNSSGTRVAVSNVARLKKSTSPVSINREDETQLVHVQGGLIDGYASTQAQQDIQAMIDEKVVVPDGVSYSLGGDFEDISQMGQTLMMIAIIAILLVFGIMAAQFESLKDPFIIFFTIPLMMIGVVAFYRISGETFSIMSAVGLVVLVGLVVNSGIVLVDYINLLLKRGYPLRKACVEAAGNRLQPIMMTTATTILGMAPLAFFGGAGTEQVQPIAQTIIGGLFASSVMTLFVSPILFALMNRRRYA